MLLTYNNKSVNYNNKWIEVENSSPPVPQGEGYWVHKDTGVITEFGLEDSSISGTTFNTPSWKNNASEISLPEGATIMASSALANSPDLVTLILPSSITSIGSNILSSTPKFENLYSYALTAPSLTSLGSNVGDYRLQIKVEADSFDSYRLASGWSNYYDKLFVLNDLIPGSRVHDGYTYQSTGITVTGQSNVVIENLEFDENTVLDSEQAPRGVILLYNCNNVIIRNCKFKNLNTRPYSINNCSNVKIYNCDIHECWHGGTFSEPMGNNQIFSCDIRNIKGVLALVRNDEFGNVVQMMATGNSEETRYLYGGNRAQDLAVDNILGYSEPEDLFSNFQSWHDPSNPYIIRNNYVRGGTIRTWGVATQLNDYGGAGVLVENNIFVNPGPGGLSICGGHDVTLRNNIVFNNDPFLPSYMKALQSWIFVPDSFPTTNRVIDNNRVYWNNQADPYGVSVPTTVVTNNIPRDTTLLDEELLPEHIIGIRKGGLPPISWFIPDPQPTMTEGSVTLTDNTTHTLDETVPFVKHSLFFVMDVYPPIREIRIPEGITYVLGKALEGQTNMLTVTFPATTEAIGTAALNNTPALTSIYCLAVTPPHLATHASNPLNALGANPANVTIYVPASSLSAYTSADVWKEYSISTI